MTKSKQKYILFLSAWYPNKYDSMCGLFVRHHAKLAAKKNKVVTLSIFGCKTEKEKYSTITEQVDGIEEVHQYFRKSACKLLNSLRYVFAAFCGIQFVFSKLGKPQLFHVNILTRYGVLALALKIIYKIPYVITEHWSRYLPQLNTYKGILRKPFTRIVVKQSNGISAVSGILKDAMIADGLNHKNFLIVPNSVNIHLFDRKEYPVKEEISILHVSNLIDKAKNVSGILKILARAKLQFPNFILNIVGEGYEIEKIKNLAVELGLKENVRYLGVIPNERLPEIICNSSFSLYFSNYETFHIAVFESLACGVPVISSNTGAIAQCMQKEFGIMVERGNAEQLYDAVIYMMQNYRQYDKEVMRRFVTENFSDEVVSAKLSELYSLCGVEC